MRRLLIALVVTASSLALADLSMVSEVTASGKTRQVTLSARGKRGYFEVKEADGPARVMLRDGEAKKMYLIDHDKKAAVVVTEEDSKAQEERQAAFKAQLEQQLSKLPPEQRARMEQGLLAQVAPPKQKVVPFTYEKKRGAARKVGAFTCEDYVIKRDGAVRGEACYATWKSVGLNAQDFQKTIAEATPKPTFGGAAMQGAPDAEAEAAAPGFPVWRKFLDEQGAVTAETTVKSVSKEALGADKFEVPKGYELKSIADQARPGAPMMPPTPPKK